MKFLLGEVKANVDPDKQKKVRVHLIGLTDGIATNNLPWASPASPECIVPAVDDKVWVIVNKQFEHEDYDYNNVQYLNYTEKTYKEAYDYQNSTAYQKRNNPTPPQSATVQEPAVVSSVEYPKNRVIQIAGVTIEFDEGNNGRYCITDKHGNYVELRGGSSASQSKVIVKSLGDLFAISGGNFKVYSSSGTMVESGSDGLEPMVLGTKLYNLLSGIISTFNSHTHASAMGPTSPPTPPPMDAAGQNGQFRSANNKVN